MAEDQNKASSRQDSACERNAKLQRKNNWITWAACLGVVLVLLLVLLGLWSRRSHSDKTHTKPASKFHMIALSDVDDLSDSATSTAISQINERQQQETKNLGDKLGKMNAKMKALMAQITALKTKKPARKPTVAPSHPASTRPQPHPGGLAPYNPHALNGNMNALPGNGSTPVAMRSGLPGVAVFHFSDATTYAHPTSSDTCDKKHCLVPGTFARAVMIGGADANASVNGQSQTTPVLFRIVKPAVLPNGHHINLKGCFVVGTVYGDISSERGEIKLTHLSCILHGHVISKKIALGTAYGIGGKEGLRGDPVMRNGKLLMYAGLSGFASGIGSAIQQSNQTQSISPLGVTTTTSPGKIFESGAAGGAQTALGKLADYYIKRADQYHPVIQLNAGSLVDVVFLSQINLKADTTSPAISTRLASAPTPLSVQQNKTMGLADAHYNMQLNQAVASQLKHSIQQHYGASS